tara:strand:+ start:374 stop:1006 length:633 start_codon:yes stop_codon:yes gene_type:complete
MHYTTVDTVKQKLRVEDTTIDNELEIYIDEVDGYINRKIRRKIGTFNEYGYEITLPLTESTNPAITYDLRTIASDLVEAKFRLKTTNDETLWKQSSKELDEYLDETFGWGESHDFRMVPQLTITPTTGAAGTVITLSGTGWKPRGQIYVKTVDGSGAGALSTTTPAIPLADENGDWSAVTITVDAGTGRGSIEILAHDKINHAIENFSVT